MIQSSVTLSSSYYLLSKTNKTNNNNIHDIHSAMKARYRHDSLVGSQQIG